MECCIASQALLPFAAIHAGGRGKGTFVDGFQGGVKIALGTDAGVDPHGQNAREFELMVTCGGMSPMQAIQAGTMNAATLIGMDHDVGSVETGKFADLVAVPGNPLADITTLQHPAFVMKGGEVVRAP